MLRSLAAQSHLSHACENAELAEGHQLTLKNVNYRFNYLEAVSLHDREVALRMFLGKLTSCRLHF